LSSWPWPSISDGLELGEVLGIDKADGFPLGVDDDEIVNVTLVEDVNGVCGQSIFAQTNRFAGHDLGQRLVEHSVALGQVAAQIAVGEDTGQFTGLVHDADAAGLGLAHHEQRVADGGGLQRDRVASAAAHDVSDL